MVPHVDRAVVRVFNWKEFRPQLTTSQDEQRTISLRTTEMAV